MLQTIYREIDFEDELTARQQRDAHLAELEAQGMECVAETLYNIVEGWRIFTLIATPPTRTDAISRMAWSRCTQRFARPRSRLNNSPRTSKVG
jgi:hypothetical protein